MLLKLGSNGNDVKKLQIKLGLNPDGDFGSETEKAVINWQKNNGLNPDGVVGDNTWDKLFETTKIKNTEGLKIENLKGIIPDKVLAQIPDTATKFNITTNLRLAHFLAQCSHESGGFVYDTELASGKAYEGRKDLGNTEPGDGVKFKGRGYVQLTGRVNYTKFSKFCNEDCVTDPTLVSKKYPLMSAAYFFDSNKLWAICDLGSSDDVVTKVTKRVNGGTNGLSDRLQRFKKIWAVLK